LLVVPDRARNTHGASPADRRRAGDNRLAETVELYELLTWVGR
jgi:hypothetical protein